jgi:hypothetical protein
LKLSRLTIPKGRKKHPRPTLKQILAAYDEIGIQSVLSVDSLFGRNKIRPILPPIL